jgi:hypothetical protein
MVRGGAEGEVTALLAHLDGVVQPSVARVAVRGVVALLVRGAHPNPLHVLRRCLVGVPCAAVDEVAGASAALVLAGAVDADAMVGELIAALAASAAAAESARPSRADAFADVLADAASDASGNGDAAYVAAALVRGVGAVVAASMGGPGFGGPERKAVGGPQTSARQGTPRVPRSGGLRPFSTQSPPRSATGRIRRARCVERPRASRSRG